MTVSVSSHRNQVWLPCATSCFTPAKYLCSRHIYVGRYHLSITRVTHLLQCLLLLAMVGKPRPCTVYRHQTALAPCLQTEQWWKSLPGVKTKRVHCAQGPSQAPCLCHPTLSHASTSSQPCQTARHRQPWAGAEEDAGSVASKWTVLPSLPFLHSLSPGTVTAMPLGSSHQDAWQQCCLKGKLFYHAGLLPKHVPT